MARRGQGIGIQSWKHQVSPSSTAQKKAILQTSENLLLPIPPPAQGSPTEPRLWLQEHPTCHMQGPVGSIAVMEKPLPCAQPTAGTWSETIPQPPHPLPPKLETFWGSRFTSGYTPHKGLIYKPSLYLLLPLPNTICNGIFICRTLCLMSVFYVRCSMRKGVVPCPLLYVPHIAQFLEHSE